MLVRTMKVGDVVQIADDIFVKVISIRGNRVQLGFDAPPSIAINADPESEDLLNLAEYRRQQMERQQRQEAIKAS